MRIIVGVSGGIAAYKAVLVVRALMERGHEVRVIPTSSALKFVGAPTWEALTGKPATHEVFDSVTEVEHVALGRWADLVAVIPATADLLARAAGGRADDLLTTTLLTTTGPVLMAPAMHTEMWQHPATVANVAVLKERGILVVEPADGRLTGADSGPGRLPEPVDLVDAIEAADPTANRPLAGLRVAISIGGTREPLDPVRFIGNRSSGRQGFALATEASRRGADVVAIVGSIESHPPRGLNSIRVGTALELRDAMLSEAQRADIIIMAAAVADFRPAVAGEHKLKKTGPDQGETVELVQNPDILAELAGSRRDSAQVVVGFAAETGDASASAIEHARDKARRKGADVLVFNDVATNDVFGAANNSVVFLDGRGAELGAATGTKADVAAALLDVVQTLRSAR
ncbi:bifunctional phosphopantothenoylcysteine decarboxylase/phosphopantothenate--cysteine ligase CoaBC [Rarobacter faecitabidus]|uniref:Coenzyme A biosynthesis bifunctional protein CoaBC n=1 Tax=Rarobacter faecitabidus TaxID=13243 RepID=A0A542ZVP2_RARFA|nr:bifunctional phosphopantothenoylcysteine decarboxylase/phosphopantothenate--cysteine ligase CoaBC [Rarobacter faecitabidus]TQL64433.1 phosphopantothenoylcysteine decarboxylase/phosphopantothenate--cysteine ligase [Rarobacter faecitabidus]